MRSWSPSPHCSLEGSSSLQEPHHPFTLEKVQMLSYFFMCDNEKGREALMSTIVLSRVWHTVSSQLKYYWLMAWLKDMIRQCILNSRCYDYYYYIFSLFFVPQLKEGTHDTYRNFIILNLIDLLFYLLKILTSLSFVTWHSAFPLPSVSFADSSSSTGPLNVRDFPNLVLHPFLSLSEHVNASQDSRDKLYAHEPQIDIFSPYPFSELQTMSPTASLLSLLIDWDEVTIRHQEE